MNANGTIFGPGGAMDADQALIQSPGFQFCLLVTEFFLLWAVIEIAFFLLRKYGFRIGYRTGWMPVSPWKYLLVTGLSIGLVVHFSRSLGLDHVILAFALGAGIVLSTLHPIAAASFFIANILLRPWELPPYFELTGVLPRLLAGVTVGSWVFHRFRERRLEIRWGYSGTLFTLLVGWLAVCTLFSGTADEDLPILLKTFLPIYILSMLVFNSADDEKDLNILKKILVIATTGVIATGIVVTMMDPRYALEGLRLEGPGLMGNSNDLGAMIAFAMPPLMMGILKWNLKERTPLGIGLDLFCLGILLFGLYLSQSRGSILSLAVAGAAFAVIYSKSMKKTLIRIAIIGIVPLIAMKGIQRNEDDLEGSSESRMNYLVTGVKMYKAHPIFGVGMNNYPRKYEQYTDIFDEWGQRTAHSTWVLFLSESGLIGLSFFTLLYFLALHRAWQVRKESPEYFLFLTSYGVAMSFLSHSYTFFPYLLVFMVFGATAAKRRESSMMTLNHSKAVSAFGLILVGTGVLGQPLTANAAGESRPQETAVMELKAVAGSDKPFPGKEPAVDSKISMKGVRGEVLNFQLRIDHADCGGLKTSEFKTQDGKIGKFPIRFYRMETVKTQHASYPGAPVGQHYDPLIPVDSKKLCDGTSVRDRVWVWGELEIPEASKPGDYTGTISKGDQKVSVSLRVWKMKLPEKPALPAYSEYISWFGLLGHYGKWHEGEADLLRKYTSEMSKHRLLPVKTVISRPEVVDDGKGKKIVELNTTPNADQSYSATRLKGLPEWAYFDFPTVNASEMEAPKTAEYFDAIERTLPRLKRPGKSLVYLWDEPARGDLPHLVKLAQKVKKHTPSTKILVTTVHSPQLEPHADILVPVMDQFDKEGFPSPETYRKFQKSGKEVWSYVSCMSHGCDALVDSKRPDFIIDRPSVYVRSISWISHRYQLDGFLYYAVNEGYRYNPKRDPWDSLWDFSGNGDGTLFYPGRPGERGFLEHQPVPSIRLKIWREASYDADYLKWMSELKNPPQWWNESFKKMVRTTSDWSRDYQAYQNLRDRIGDYLNER